MTLSSVISPWASAQLVGVEVGERHVANALGVEVAEEAEGVLDGMAAFDAHEGGDLVLLVGAYDVVGGGREDEVVRVGGDDVGANGVDHGEGAVGGVVVLDVGGVDVDGEELGGEEAFHAGEVGLTEFVGLGDVVAGDGLGGYVVVGVDEEGLAGDLVDLGLGDGLVRGVCAGRATAITVLRAQKATMECGCFGSMGSLSALRSVALLYRTRSGGLLFGRVERYAGINERRGRFHN